MEKSSEHAEKKILIKYTFYKIPRIFWRPPMRKHKAVGYFLQKPTHHYF